jgi:gamma-glutamyl-gamma-aminobutyrate hydrolase PuuD
VEQAKHGAWDEESALVPMSYVSAVIRSGGWPVLLPPAPVEPRRVLALFDGLVITGGPDVDPSRYGAARHQETGRPRPDRDAWEASLCQAALAVDVPLLAICRGLQVLNVAQGGTLHQHLPDVVGHSGHRVAPGQMRRNQIRVHPGTQTAAVLGTDCTGLCHHHQAIDRLGDGLTAVGFAEDEIVEAVEIAGKAFAVGVQWHPEDNPDDVRLFQALIEAAIRYRRDRAPGARE